MIFATACHGTRLLWCSSSVSTMPSPGSSRSAQWQNATVFRACVAPLVNTVSSGDAPMKHASVARASSYAAVAAAASACAERCGLAFAVR